MTTLILRSRVYCLKIVGRVVGVFVVWGFLVSFLFAGLFGGV